MDTAALILAALLSASTVDIETILAIPHPAGAAWSPDGERIAFVWDRAGVQNLFLVDRVGGWPEARTHYVEGLLSPPFWGPDGTTLYYEREGDLWSLAVGRDGSGALPEAVFGTDAIESGARLSPDGSQVAFLRLGDVWVRQLATGRERRLTVTLVTESGLEWSPDGERIAFQYARATAREDEHPFVGQKLGFRRAEREAPNVGVVSVSGGAVVAVATSPAAELAPRWADAQRLVLQRISEDFRTREILLADVVTGEVRSLHKDTDERWWSLSFLGAEPKPSPGGRLVAFVSDRSGWDSLYVAAIDGGAVHRLTEDGEEIRRYAWSPDGARIAFDTNRGHPGQRHLAVVDVRTPESPVTRVLTEGRGTNVQPPGPGGFDLIERSGGWSPDGTKLLFQHTDPRRPAELFWIDASGQGSPRELTYSLPASFDQDSFVEPELVHYPSTDGREVPAYLFVPRDLDRTRKHPAIIWIHGDGIAQNYDGWHVRRDYAVYYSFHQYLVGKGYIVLAPDYRGSTGYGREWRVGPYRDLGGIDYEDIAASVPYLERVLYVDPERIGIWGLSYGGFLTLQGLTLDPRLFRCGVDVAGVHDFRYWFRDPGGIWIGGRLGNPEENAAAYVRAAPVTRVDRIERPLLVLHGTADVNVPFVESLALVDALLKRNKDVDFVVYPGEFHYFHREHVLRDAWRRVEAFFDRHLGEDVR